MPSLKKSCFLVGIFGIGAIVYSMLMLPTHLAGPVAIVTNGSTHSGALLAVVTERSPNKTISAVVAIVQQEHSPLSNVSAVVQVLATGRSPNVNASTHDNRTIQHCNPNLTPSVDAWYINVASATERAQCMETQLHALDFHGVYRYEADPFPKECGIHDIKCLKTHKWADCVFSGKVRYEKLSLHGTKDHDTESTVQHAWSNYCSHLRLFASLAKMHKEADYVVIFEDDVVISDRFVEYVQRLICLYKDREWVVIQLEPFGYVDAGNATVWWDENRSSTVFTDPNYIGDNWGYHALLARRKALRMLARCMTKKPVVPIDFIHRNCLQGKFLSAKVRPNVVQQPEMFTEGMVGFRRKRLPLPTYCSEAVLDSMIR